MLHGSTFLNVGVLLSADVHLPVVLEMLKARANPWLKERIEDALHGVNIGANLGEALHRAGHDFSRQARSSTSSNYFGTKRLRRKS
ncbi:type II secretion system F family protein [Undibacterium arcticum]